MPRFWASERHSRPTTLAGLYDYAAFAAAFPDHREVSQLSQISHTLLFLASSSHTSPAPARPPSPGGCRLRVASTSRWLRARRPRPMRPRPSLLLVPWERAASASASGCSRGRTSASSPLTVSTIEYERRATPRSKRPLTARSAQRCGRRYDVSYSAAGVRGANLNDRLEAVSKPIGPGSRPWNS